jgi:cytoskeletal protein RodZ
MSDRFVPFVLAAVAFTATVAVLWNRQTENESQPSPSHAQARKQQISAISAAFQPVSTSTPQEPKASLHAFTPTRVAPTESETPAVSAQSTADEVDAELPVSMNFRRAPGHEGLEGGIANLAGHALDITATLLAAGTGQQQQVQFTVAPGAGHRIGAADGWEMHSGDQITVHSPPFQDRVFAVP